MAEIKYCPECGQKMMTYRRSIRRNMAHLLRKLDFDHGRQARRIDDLDKRTVMISDFTKLKYWGLIHDTGENLWMITSLGVEFVLGKVPAPKYRWIYNNTIQPTPKGKDNPLLFIWEIPRVEISKETVLRDAEQYSVTDPAPAAVEQGQMNLIA